MFNNNYPTAVGTNQACKPDPEEMLQHARKREVRIEQGLDALRTLGENNYYFNQKSEEGIVMALGQLTAAKWEVEKEIERWLKEIDK